MDYILFDDLVDQLPIVDPNWFKVETEYGYDPVTKAKKPDVNPVTEYWVSFLTTADQFNLIRTKLLAQYSQYRTNGEVTTLPLTVLQNQTANLYDGTYEIFWVLEPGWFERLGSDNFRISLHGYGEPTESFGSILPNQVFTISESSPIGTIIGVVKGFNAEADIDSNPNIPFSYDPGTGTLAVAKALDYEAEPEFTISIGNTPITIYVLDEVEAPLHERTTYVFYVQRTTTPGSVIGSVTASIQGTSGLKPTYSIVSGNSGGNFSIDPVVGDIVALSMLGILDNHVIGINDGHGVTLTCTLRVLDAPLFSTYRFTIASTVLNGAIVGVISEPGYTLSYSDSIFELQGDNLVVVNNQELQPGIYDLSIVTTLGGALLCYVYVTDLSATTGFEYWIPSDSSNGSLVGNPELGYYGYSISPNTIFGINSTNGDIFVTSGSLLTATTYSLTISNLGATLTTPITIVSYAVVTEADAQFEVAESTPVGTFIGNIGGTGPYTINSGNYGNFLLSPTGDITVGVSPVAATQFTVSDTLSTPITVVLTLLNTTGDGFIGVVMAGQQGQSVVASPNVLYSVGPVGFGQGTLQIQPDNTTTPTRTLVGSIVVGIPDTLTYSLTVSAEVTQPMLDALLPLYGNNSTIVVAVPGTDWDASMVELSYTYSDTITVSLTCMSS